MTAPLDALWRAEPLTTRSAMVLRSAQTGTVVNAIRADGWTDDMTRRAVARRLLFTRWRCNRRGRLHLRGVSTMRVLWLDLVMSACVVGMLVEAGARWIGRRL